MFFTHISTEASVFNIHCYIVVSMSALFQTLTRGAPIAAALCGLLKTEPALKT